MAKIIEQTNRLAETNGEKPSEEITKLQQEAMKAFQKAIQEAATKYNCHIEPIMIITGKGNIPQIQVVYGNQQNA